MKKNGYTLKRANGRDKIYIKVEADGTIRRTAVSKGTGEIGTGLMKRIIKEQLGLTQDEYDQMK
ncbi:hypothetical protein L2089_15465 [Paenibacillus hunanensis]|nr:hypothetical protein [Paenibacillus hunanensis]